MTITTTTTTSSNSRLFYTKSRLCARLSFYQLIYHNNIMHAKYSNKKNCKMQQRNSKGSDLTIFAVSTTTTSTSVVVRPMIIFYGLFGIAAVILPAAVLVLLCCCCVFPPDKQCDSEQHHHDIVWRWYYYAQIQTPLFVYYLAFSLFLNLLPRVIIIDQQSRFSSKIHINKQDTHQITRCAMFLFSDYYWK